MEQKRETQKTSHEHFLRSNLLINKLSSMNRPITHCQFDYRSLVPEKLGLRRLVKCLHSSGNASISTLDLLVLTGEV